MPCFCKAMQYPIKSNNMNPSKTMSIASFFFSHCPVYCAIIIRHQALLAPCEAIIKSSNLSWGTDDEQLIASTNVDNRQGRTRVSIYAPFFFFFFPTSRYRLAVWVHMKPYRMTFDREEWIASDSAFSGPCSIPWNPKIYGPPSDILNITVLLPCPEFFAITHEWDNAPTSTDHWHKTAEAKMWRAYALSSANSVLLTGVRVLHYSTMIQTRHFLLGKSISPPSFLISKSKGHAKSHEIHL